MTMRVVQIHAHGGPEVLQCEEAKIPEPAANQVLVKIAAAGVNFIDTYQRTGLYPNASGEWPLPLGKEGAGIVTKLGDGVSDLAEGARVTFSGAQGTYAEHVCVPAAACVAVPDGMDLYDAAAVLLQGLTAHYLVTSTHPVKEGDTVLIHAGAGGTGGQLIQIAKLLGATVIATAGSKEKADIAAGHGADHTIIYTEQDFLAEVKRITGDKGVPVVFDGVGKATWEKSLACISPTGHLVIFGNASGAVPPIDPLTLTRAGSISLTRPSLFHYVTDGQLHTRSAELFGWIADGKVKVHIGKKYALSEARQAQEDLEGRKTVGKLLLVP